MMQSQVNKNKQRVVRIADIYKRGLAPLQENFDPQRHLVYQNRQQITYRPATSLPFAETLLKEGTVVSIAEAVDLYALNEHQQVNSLKTVVAFHSGEDIEQLSINSRNVLLSELPVEVYADDWVIVTDGAVHIAVKALEPSRLGLDVPDGITVQKR